MIEKYFELSCPFQRAWHLIRLLMTIWPLQYVGKCYLGLMIIQGRSKEFILTEARGLMASAGARAYNGGLGAEPPAGSKGRAPGQGVRGASPP